MSDDKSFKARLADVRAVLVKLEPEDTHRRWLLDSITQNLATKYDPPPPRNKTIEDEVKALRDSARSILAMGAGKLHSAGISNEMIQAIITIDQVEIFRSHRQPSPGAKTNKQALAVARKFFDYYFWLTGKRAGINRDHDFVMTLGGLFAALGIQADAQHYARLAKEEAGGRHTIIVQESPEMREV
jgi:hypothetical protein